MVMKDRSADRLMFRLGATAITESYSLTAAENDKYASGFVQLPRTRFSRAATARAGSLRLGQPTGILVA